LIGGGPGSELLGVASVSREQDKPFNITMNVHDMADWQKPLAPMLEYLEKEWQIGKDVIDYTSHVTDILDLSNPKVSNLLSALIAEATK
jgi:hypothetical protein